MHEPAVERAVGPVRCEVEHVVSEPAERARRTLGERLRGLRLRAQQVLQGLRGRGEALLPGGDEAAQVAAQDERDRLVDSDPQADIRQGGADPLCQTAQPADAFPVLPPSGLPEPRGVRVVKERDHRLDSERAQQSRPLRLPLQGRRVELARARLQPAPLDRVAVGVGADGRQEGQVLPPPLAVARGRPAADLRSLSASRASPIPSSRSRARPRPGTPRSRHPRGSGESDDRAIRSSRVVEGRSRSGLG